MGIAIDPAFSNAQGRASADFAGWLLPTRRWPRTRRCTGSARCSRRTLVIFDEVHHAGDALSWGEAARAAFDPARRRWPRPAPPFAATPTRSRSSPTRAAPPGPAQLFDYTYGYGPALTDGVVRPVIFLAYSGEMRWRTRAGDELGGTLGAPMTLDQLGYAWRTALDPGGAWIMPGAGGSRPAAGRGTAGHARHGRAGHRHRSRGRAGLRTAAAPDRRHQARCRAVRRPGGQQEDRAVRRLGRPVDGRRPDGLRRRRHPRLAVGVYATSVGTALFFAQAVGRFVRARRRGGDCVGVPAVHPVAAGLCRGAGSRARSCAASAW